jgi:hypothetical protein
MVRNYLGFFGLLWLLAGPALAAEVTVGDLTLSYAAPWDRSLPKDEDAENSAILHWQEAGATMTVFLPYHQVELKVEEGRFFRQLEQKWRALYGADARVYPMEVAGTPWRVCRRPSLERDATVFQMVTVHEGRAHHVLVIAAGRQETLPDAALQLVSSAAWVGPRSVVLTRVDREDRRFEPVLPLSTTLVLSPPRPEPVASNEEASTPPAAPAAGSPPQAVAAVAASPAPVAAPAVPADPAPEPPVSVSFAPAGGPPTQQVKLSEPAIPAPRPEAAAKAGVSPKRQADKPWRLVRAIHVLPKGAGLAALAEAESARLGGQGVLSGYSLVRQGHGIEGFVEGFLWQEGAGKRPVRQAFSRRWQFAWQPPAEIRPGEQAWKLAVSENSQEGWPGQPAILNLRLELLALCGSRNALVATFNALENAASADTGTLHGLACPMPKGEVPAASLALPAGGATVQSLRLAVPEAWMQGDGGAAGTLKRLVFVAQYPSAQPEPGLGDALLAGARSYYIYVPKE